MFYRVLSTPLVPPVKYLITLFVDYWATQVFFKTYAFVLLNVI